ncbi:hypothetical protein HG535_0A08860 [Zygotorulaspora mrakii]|uniref:DNA replication complex GINS protein PSF3 n=1 Tax=Zygotorulaspora mrakii TaxID=42260 RepID=A0A7H9AYT5_ZYGMR|nr:uncharacterized protein HG535_0A08860 [Zygotorulaspora mrakii]QLG70939.1 hypothetical protein HG535_0A08860 [Zygotorulaspora mrakii]
MGYFDIEDVLADSVEVPCKFQFKMPGLGYLEGNPGRAIEKNSKLNLPLWLARILAIVGGGSDEDTEYEPEEPIPFVELLKPDFFATKFINSAKASPESLDVHSVNAYFYSLAVKWITLFEDKELASVVSEMLLARALEINNHAGSVNIVTSTTTTDSRLESHSVHFESANKNSQFLMTLDQFEKDLHRHAHDSYKQTKRWMVER